MSANQPALVPISYTFVEYQKGDTVGYLLAWSSLLPIFLLSAFVTLITFRRELHTMTYFLGIFVNEALNMVLKHTIRQPRPNVDLSSNFNKFGMPSSHAQFLWFFAVYFLFFMYSRVAFRNAVWKHLSVLLALASAVVVSVSRVYLGYHSVNQVLAGAVVGAAFAAVWFWATETLFTPLFKEIVQHPLAKFLMVRDSSSIPNILFMEYVNALRMNKQAIRQRGSYEEQRGSISELLKSS